MTADVWKLRAHRKTDVAKSAFPALDCAIVGGCFARSLNMASCASSSGVGDSHGSLRVRVLAAEALPLRADGCACEPYVTVAVVEHTRRRIRRTVRASGSEAEWNEFFDFDRTSDAAQIVVDVWDQLDNEPARLLGKAVYSVAECRPGIPHLLFLRLLVGTLALRVLFDFADLPSEEEEQGEIEPNNPNSAAAAAVIERAKQYGLPERLTLGLTIDAMEDHLRALPLDAVALCNASIPRRANGTPKFPANQALNGYVNQFHIVAASASENISLCERLQQQGHNGVGVATVFVSWFLGTPLTTLIDALRQYLRRHRELPADTKFWICDFVIRQREPDVQADIERLGDCVSAVGRTVLLMEPWDAPVPLKRAYCILEVYHTVKSGAQFQVTMSQAQQAAFETALVEEFEKIAEALGTVDVRKCECRKQEETERILGALDRDVGLSECNEAVIEQLRLALVEQARTAFKELPPDACRSESELMSQVAELLMNMDHLDEAEELFHEQLFVLRADIGDGDEVSISLMLKLGAVLRMQGKLDKAEEQLREALYWCRETLGNDDIGIFQVLDQIAIVLWEKGDLDDAEALFSDAMEGFKEAVSKGTMSRDEEEAYHGAMLNYGNFLLEEKGDLAAAEPLLREAFEWARETFGSRAQKTLTTMSSFATLLQAQDTAESLAAAEVLYREALEASRETLGSQHSDTLEEIEKLAGLLWHKGELDVAETLFREAVQARREKLGAHDPETLKKIGHLALFLQKKGKLADAETLFREVWEAERQTIGSHHPNTLASISNLAGLLVAKGDLAGAELLVREAVQVGREMLGSRSSTTLQLIHNLGSILDKKGDTAAAEPLLREALQAPQERVVLTYDDFYNEWGKPRARPSGLKWKEVGTATPINGTELTNEALAKALETEREFTQAEWDSFDIEDLTVGHFIRVGDEYFLPDGR